MEVENFCSSQRKVPQPFADSRKGRARLTRDELWSLTNFRRIGLLFPEKFDDTSLLDFVHLEIINTWKRRDL